MILGPPQNGVALRNQRQPARGSLLKTTPKVVTRWQIQTPFVCPGLAPKSVSEARSGVSYRELRRVPATGSLASIRHFQLPYLK